MATSTCATTWLGSDCLIVSNETVAPLYLDRLKANLAGSNTSTARVARWRVLQDRLRRAGIVLDELVGGRRQSRHDRGCAGRRRGRRHCRFCGGMLHARRRLRAGADYACSRRWTRRSAARPASTIAQGKNLIGAFHQPRRRAYRHRHAGDTCQQRELSAGLAEVIKYGAIADVGFLRLAGRESSPRCWRETRMRSLMRYSAPARSRPKSWQRTSAKPAAARS